MNNYMDLKNWSKEEWKEAIEAGTLTVAAFALTCGFVWFAAIISGRV